MFCPMSKSGVHDLENDGGVVDEYLMKGETYKTDKGEDRLFSDLYNEVKVKLTF